MTTEDDHKHLVQYLAKPGSAILADMAPHQAHLLHMAVGVSGEAGELLDAIKKHVIYQKTLDVRNVIEELGDIEFYMRGIRDALGIHRNDVLQHNVNKLRTRYASGEFSNEAAQKRADKSHTQD
jgi:NTP pyrophosphatase (non-canonical NTP hydrolase)